MTSKLNYSKFYNVNIDYFNIELTCFTSMDTPKVCYNFLRDTIKAYFC